MYPIGQHTIREPGYHENLAVNLSQKYDLAFDVAQHLVRNYGTREPCLHLGVKRSRFSSFKSADIHHFLLFHVHAIPIFVVRLRPDKTWGEPSKTCFFVNPKLVLNPAKIGPNMP